MTYSSSFSQRDAAVFEARDAIVRGGRTVPTAEQLTAEIESWLVRFGATQHTLPDRSMLLTLASTACVLARAASPSHGRRIGRRLDLGVAMAALHLEVADLADRYPSNANELCFAGLLLCVKVAHCLGFDVEGTPKKKKELFGFKWRADRDAVRTSGHNHSIAFMHVLTRGDPTFYLAHHKFARACCAMVNLLATQTIELEQRHVYQRADVGPIKDERLGSGRRGYDRTTPARLGRRNTDRGAN